jgi:hypothetical protein
LLCERRANTGTPAKTLAMLAISIQRRLSGATAGRHETPCAANFADAFTGD